MMTPNPANKNTTRFLIFILLWVLLGTLIPTPSPAQIKLGGDKKKEKEEEKPLFPHKKLKGTIATVRLEERRFLLNTSDGLALLVQVDDKTKIQHRKDKKGKSNLIFADFKAGDAVEVSGQLPPTRILQAEKIILEEEPKK